MRDLDTYTDEIRNFFRNHADPAVIKKYQKYFTEGYDAYGVDGAVMEAQYDGWREEWDLSDEEATALAGKLFPGKYEEVVYGIWFLRDLKQRISKEHFHLLKEWFDNYITNWALCDVAVTFVIGNLFKYGVIRYPDFRSWRSSRVSWTRRAVPVSFIWIIKRDPLVDPSKLFGFIDPLTTDPEKCVRQGMGWFLREAWKKYPEVTEEYLLKIKDYAPRLIIQYATERMKAAEKERFRRTK
jgi:hypothetical protein